MRALQDILILNVLTLALVAMLYIIALLDARTTDRPEISNDMLLSPVPMAPLYKDGDNQ